MTPKEQRQHFENWLDNSEPKEGYEGGIMRPSPEIDQIIVEKSKILSENQLIRIGGGEYEKSYWIFLIGKELYVGTIIVDDIVNNGDSTLPNYYLKSPDSLLLDRNKKPAARIQLFIWPKAETNDKL